MRMLISMFLLLIFQFTTLGFANESIGRIQEPKRPYPYIEKEVIFKNPTDGVVLSGTLTLPSMQGPFPAVILVHGSGPFDRDESFFGHKPFLVWADHLTKQGIAVLRFDKRGFGKSTGDYETAFIEDFANDALAGVEYLKTLKEINAKQIGLIGHSEGGMTASLSTSKSSDVAFTVLMASPAVNWKELAHVHVGLFQKAEGVPEETISSSRNLLKRVFALLEKQKNRELAETELREMLLKDKNGLASSQRGALESYYGTIEDQVKLFNSKWFRYYLTYDPAHVLKKIKTPVLALNGDLDLQVCSKQNLPVIARALKKARNRDYKIMEVPGLNHIFQTCKTGSMREYPVIDETASPVALGLMSQWILEKTHSVSKKK